MNRLEGEDNLAPIVYFGDTRYQMYPGHTSYFCLEDRIQHCVASGNPIPPDIAGKPSIMITTTLDKALGRYVIDKIWALGSGQRYELTINDLKRERFQAKEKNHD